MRFYRVIEDKAAGYTGDLSNAAHRWTLPGMNCPHCGTVGGWTGLQYPCVDLSGLPARELKKLADGWPVAPGEFVRRRELVRPLAPPDALLKTGTTFGPLTGTGLGRFGPLVMQNPWTLLMQQEALERLQDTGLQGLRGCLVDVRFRTKLAPRLCELQLLAQGSLHPDCLPSERKPPCPVCERVEVTLPATHWLDAASLPLDLDVFRLADWPTFIIASEPLVEAVRRLELGGVLFQELEAL